MLQNGSYHLKPFLKILTEDIAEKFDKTDHLGLLDGLLLDLVHLIAGHALSSSVAP